MQTVEADDAMEEEIHSSGTPAVQVGEGADAEGEDVPSGLQGDSSTNAVNPSTQGRSPEEEDPTPAEAGKTTKKGKKLVIRKGLAEKQEKFKPAPYSPAIRVGLA